MLWVKAFHIVFVASWFAGLFYLPRIFVNLAMVPPGSVAERDRLLEQGMGTDQHVDIPEGESFEHVVALAAALAPGEEGDVDAGRGGERRDGVEVLPRQDFGRRHQRRLPARFDHGRGREQCHHRLARSDVALQQPQHALRLGEIGGDLGDRASLRRRQRVWQRLDQLFPDMAGAGGRAAGRAPYDALFPHGKRPKS